MMRHEDSEDQLLFDLPLDPVAAGPNRPDNRPDNRPEPRRAPAPVRPRPESSPARATAPPLASIIARDDEEDTGVPEDLASAAGAGLGSRLAAGVADLLIHAAVLMILLIGTRLLGVRTTLEDAPAFALFLLAFSFLYTIVPLAFWGHTLGMAWTGLISQNRDGEPLTFDQTARRWLGALLTLAAAGLPLLLALGGRSLADLLSGSVTWSERGEEAPEPEAA